MKYEMPIRVRYSETNKNGIVDLHKILEYFQDSTIFQSESLGYKVSDELAINRGWFLLAWNVEIDHFPALGDRLIIVTEPYKMRGFYGYRRFMLLNENKDIIARADSLWLLMDLTKMLPQRVPKDMAEAYIQDVTDDKIRVKRKLPENGDWMLKEKLVVNRHYLDSNSHVNNTFYALWAEECLPKEFQIKKIRIDYRQSAFEHDIISIDTIEEENNIRYRFTNQEGILLALVEFQSTEKN